MQREPSIDNARAARYAQFERAPHEAVRARRVFERINERGWVALRREPEQNRWPRARQRGSQSAEFVGLFAKFQPARNEGRAEILMDAVAERFAQRLEIARRQSRDE